MHLNTNAGGMEERNITAGQCFLNFHETPRTLPPGLGPPADPGHLYTNLIFVFAHFFSF